MKVMKFGLRDLVALFVVAAVFFVVLMLVHDYFGVASLISGWAYALI